MNTASRRVAAFLLLTLVALAGLACALVPTLVEDAARARLAELPAALAGQGVALEPPEVETVSFSLFSRELALRNVRLTGKLMSADGQKSHGSFLATAEDFSVRLSFRATLLATPLGRFLLPDGQAGAELFPVAETVNVRELTASTAEASLAMTLSATAATADDVAVDSALLRRLLTGERLPAGADAIDWLYAFAAAGFRLTGLALSLDAPATDESLSASCAEFMMRGLSRRHLAEQEARDIRCALLDGQAITIASLRQEAVALPEKALLRPLAEELARPEVSEARLQAALKTALSGPEPLVGKGVLAGLVLPMAAAGDQALRLERAALTWRGGTPIDQELSIEGLSLPTAALTQEAGIVLAGLSTLSLNAGLAVRGTGPGAGAPERYSGNLAARNLCSLAYAFTLDPQGYAGELAVLRGAYSGASLKYADEGLLPRLAAGVMPSPEAAMMALKVGLARFCSMPTPENAALRAALETFVERPGTLSLTARKPFNLLEALVTVGEGNAGALMDASAEAGPLTLGQAMREIESRGR